MKRSDRNTSKSTRYVAVTRWSARLVLERDAAHIEQRRVTAGRGRRRHGLLLPRQAIEVDVAAGHDDPDLRSGDVEAYASSRHASGTADEGSMIIFIRSQVIRIARTIASSDAVPIPAAPSRIAASVRGASVVRRPSAMVVAGGSGSTFPELVAPRGVVGVRRLGTIDADRRPSERAAIAVPDRSRRRLPAR